MQDLLVEHVDHFEEKLNPVTARWSGQVKGLFIVLKAKVRSATCVMQRYHAPG